MISPTAAMVTVVSGSVGTTDSGAFCCASAVSPDCSCCALRLLQPRTIRTIDKIRITSSTPRTMRCCTLRRRRCSSRLSRLASSNCSSRSNSCSSIKTPFPAQIKKRLPDFANFFTHYTISHNFAQRGISPAEKVKPWRIASNVLQWLQSFPKERPMKNSRSRIGRTRLILILLCIVLAAAMLWCAVSLISKVGTYSSRTVGDDKPAEEVPVEPADLEPTVAENSYDPAGFYEEGGFKRYKSADTIASVGVDVSSHQQDIDWELVAANGVEFAMIRVGYRGYTEGEIQPDDYFTQNIEGALAAGLDVGVYFFSQALDEKEAIDEANFVLEKIKDYPLSYPVIFDWEDIQADARTDGMDSVQLTKNAIAFCGAVEKAGYRAGVYFNQRFGYEEFDLESLQDYVFWLAEYNETPSFSYHFQLWQYCNDGRVDGIQTDVDLNLAFLRAKH
ncbi:MAG TPA: hypothetical protein DEQ85_00170 [Clostridiales bacterium]|nr:hypothetical protein [Clostridiales bacterium]